MDKTLSVVLTPSQSWSETDDNEVVLRIPQSSSIVGASPSDSLVSYQDTCWGGVYPDAEMLSVLFCRPSRLGQRVS